MTTDQISECLYPYVGTSRLFRMLKELGYVEWADKRYVLTAKALDGGLGEADPRHPRDYLRWSKRTFDLLQAELDKRSTLESTSETEDPKW